MNTREYLERIGVRGSTEPGLANLRALHTQHLLAVPFENLDIHAQRRLSLDLDDLFDKIVIRRRGGFCYELNGLFAWLLRTLGYRVDLLSARVVNDTTNEAGPPFDHMALLVHLDQRWLADVGFGDGFRQPLCVDMDRVQEQEGEDYSLEAGADGEFSLHQRKAGEDWRTQYHFKLQPHEMHEFEPMCRYHETSPQSHFSRQRLCTIATPNGRMTLTDNKWVVSDQDERSERELVEPGEFDELLREHFKLT